MPEAAETPVPPLRSALVLGCGYLGLRVARRWIESGIDTFAVTRSSDKAVEFRRRGLTALVGDFAAAEWSPDLPSVDVVLWSVGLDRDQGATRDRVWNHGLRRVLRHLQARPPRMLLYASSTGVYGDMGGGDADESTPPDPVSEGGLACLAGERLVAEYSASAGVRCCCLRLAGIYGPDRLLRRIDDLHSGKPIAADPDAWLNLIHVSDAVELISSISRMKSPPEVVNLVSTRPVTRKDYYTTLAETVGAPAPVFEAGRDAGIAVTRRRGSGNRRVTSTFRNILPAQCQFDDLRAGLQHALQNSAQPD